MKVTKSFEICRYDDLDNHAKEVALRDYMNRNLPDEDIYEQMNNFYSEEAHMMKVRSQWYLANGHVYNERVIDKILAVHR